MEHLARDWPELVPRYERLYAGRAYLSKGEVEPVRREVAELRHRFEVGDPVLVARPLRVVERPSRAQQRPSSGRAQSLRMPPRSKSRVPIQLALDALEPSMVDRSAPAMPARNPASERAVTGA